jgi:hypothetical protein
MPSWHALGELYLLPFHSMFILSDLQSRLSPTVRSHVKIHHKIDFNNSRFRQEEIRLVFRDVTVSNKLTSKG